VCGQLVLQYFSFRFIWLYERLQKGRRRQRRQC